MRPHRVLAGAVGGALVVLVAGSVPAARTATPEVAFDPKIAPVGATVFVYGPCSGRPAEDVRVVLSSPLPVGWRSPKIVSIKVDRRSGLGWTFRVPRIEPGPYMAAIACGGDVHDLIDNGVGPMFTVEPRVAPGAKAHLHLWWPCGTDDADAALWEAPTVLLGRARDAAGPADTGLTPATVVRHAADGDDGFYVEIVVPQLAPGRYFAYSLCGDHFRLQDAATLGRPVLRVLGAPDTAAASLPESRPGPGPLTGALAAGAAFLCVLVALLARPARPRRPRRPGV